MNGNTWGRVKTWCFVGGVYTGGGAHIRDANLATYLRGVYFAGLIYGGVLTGFYGSFNIKQKMEWNICFIIHLKHQTKVF